MIRTIRESDDVKKPARPEGALYVHRAAGARHPRYAVAPPGRPGTQEDRGRVHRGHQAHRRAGGILANPRACWRSSPPRNRPRSARRAAQDAHPAERRQGAHRRGPHRRRGRRHHRLGSRLHQAPAAGDLPPPGPRRQGHHRGSHGRGRRRRPPAGGQHPRLGALLHQPRPRLQLQGARRAGCQPAGQGHPHHQPRGCPGRRR